LLADAGTSRVQPGFAQFLEALSRAPSGAEQLATTIARWDRFRVEMQRFLEQRDAILCPVNAEPALPHGALQQKVAAFSYTITYNLTGQPVVVVRAGTSPDGLPIGVQLIARPWREDVALALATHLEQALGSFPRPNL
jgi:amidase